ARLTPGFFGAASSPGAAAQRAGSPPWAWTATRAQKRAKLKGSTHELWTLDLGPWSSRHIAHRLPGPGTRKRRLGRPCARTPRRLIPRAAGARQKAPLSARCATWPRSSATTLQTAGAYWRCEREDW